MESKRLVEAAEESRHYIEGPEQGGFIEQSLNSATSSFVVREVMRRRPDIVACFADATSKAATPQLSRRN